MSADFEKYSEIVEKQKRIMEIRKKEEELEEELASLSKERNNIRSSIDKLHNSRMCETYNVKYGDIIKSNNEEYKFVGFEYLGSDPKVRYKLESGGWSKNRRVLHMYDWEGEDHGI